MHYTRIDTRLADGVYVQFDRITEGDDRATPSDYGCDDNERIEAWRCGYWSYIGISAEAEICVVENGSGTLYSLRSAGLWGIESDSNEEYLNEVFRDECGELKRHITMFGKATFVDYDEIAKTVA
jgi:hypothetical protein